MVQPDPAWFGCLPRGSRKFSAFARAMFGLAGLIIPATTLELGGLKEFNGSGVDFMTPHSVWSNDRSDSLVHSHPCLTPQRTATGPNKVRGTQIVSPEHRHA